jgi:hypothetical protein
MQRRKMVHLFYVEHDSRGSNCSTWNKKFTALSLLDSFPTFYLPSQPIVSEDIEIGRVIT